MNRSSDEGHSPGRFSVGDRLPAVVRTPTTRDLVKYAAASGDLYEIHYDDRSAREAGLPGVIVHGLLKAAWLADLVGSWAGPDAFVRELETSYRGIDQPGHPYAMGGIVRGLSGDQHAPCVMVELWGESARGQRTTTGSAVVELTASPLPPEH